MSKPDLKPILSQIVAGDQIAFREVFDMFYPKVYSFALKLTHSTSLAEEIVQEVFVKIWVGRESLSSINYFPSYLYTITRNHAFNVLKKIAIEERIKETLKKELSEAQEDTEDVSRYQDQHGKLVHAVNQLPPQQRLVYSLCHQQGLKYEEVAEQLNISRLTVKTHMQKALRTIRSHFRSTIGLLILLIGL